MKHIIFCLLALLFVSCSSLQRPIFDGADGIHESPLALSRALIFAIDKTDTSLYLECLSPDTHPQKVEINENDKALVMYMRVILYNEIRVSELDINKVTVKPRGEGYQTFYDGKLI